MNGNIGRATMAECDWDGDDIVKRIVERYQLHGSASIAADRITVATTALKMELESAGATFDQIIRVAAWVVNGYLNIAELTEAAAPGGRRRGLRWHAPRDHLVAECERKEETIPRVRAVANIAARTGAMT